MSTINDLGWGGRFGDRLIFPWHSVLKFIWWRRAIASYFFPRKGLCFFLQWPPAFRSLMVVLQIEMFASWLLLFIKAAEKLNYDTSLSYTIWPCLPNKGNWWSPLVDIDTWGQSVPAYLLSGVLHGSFSLWTDNYNFSKKNPLSIVRHYITKRVKTCVSNWAARGKEIDQVAVLIHCHKYNYISPL